ncbi:MAG TPA: DUF58 domain-containing protein, partial [Methylomirabilota bacterium]|nr:DUF58 domain-containing protein [Methylomirabilota bacterium]
LLLDLVLLGAVWLDARLAPHPADAVLGVEREAPSAFSTGHPVSAAYVWRNQSMRRARLRLREVRPDLLGGPQPPRRVEVPAGGRVREVVTVTPGHRGRDRAGALHLESTGPMGLGARRAVRVLPWDVVVYPPLVPMRLRASVAEARRRRDPGLHRAHRLGEGRLFESLREWVPGDDIRTIDWKATARRHKVITRQYEAERRQQVLLVLDAGRLMTAEIGGVARLDAAVDAALELAYAAVQHDDNVGVMAFADGVQYFVPPERGRAGLRAVLDVLAVVQPSLVEPDYPGAFRYLAVRNRKRALTVLFTDVIDRLASEALLANVASLRPRHLPLAVVLRNPELDDTAQRRPADVHQAFRRAAAEELLRARDEALGHMRRAGIIVLDVPPARAARAVVTQYVDLKRRGVL